MQQSRAAVIQRRPATFCTLKDCCCFLINKLLEAPTVLTLRLGNVSLLRNIASACHSRAVSALCVWSDIRLDAKSTGGLLVLSALQHNTIKHNSTNPSVCNILASYFRGKYCSHLHQVSRPTRSLFSAQGASLSCNFVWLICAFQLWALVSDFLGFVESFKVCAIISTSFGSRAESVIDLRVCEWVHAHACVCVENTKLCTLNWLYHKLVELRISAATYSQRHRKCKIVPIVSTSRDSTFGSWKIYWVPWQPSQREMLQSSFFILLCQKQSVLLLYSVTGSSSVFFSP